MGKAVWVDRAALGSNKMGGSPRFSKSRNLYQQVTVGIECIPPSSKSGGVIRNLGETMNIL